MQKYVYMGRLEFKNSELRNDYYDKCDENIMLKREIKKINPDFDFDKLWHGF